MCIEVFNSIACFLCDTPLQNVATPRQAECLFLNLVARAQPQGVACMRRENGLSWQMTLPKEDVMFDVFDVSSNQFLDLHDCNLINE